MLKTLLQPRTSPALLLHASPITSSSLLYDAPSPYKLISNRAYKNKYNPIKTFLSDKERVKSFVRLLDPEEQKLLQKELNFLRPYPKNANLNANANANGNAYTNGNASTGAVNANGIYINGNAASNAAYATSDQANQAEPDTESQVQPNFSQLLTVAIHQSIPFLAFGFLDNMIMIFAGEYIDITLGASLGISTLASAALGNAVSDVAGVNTASIVERAVDKIGMKQPQLSLVQLQMPRARWATQLGRAIGVAIGCILGMCPLLFRDREEVDAKKVENEAELIIEVTGN